MRWTPIVATVAVLAGLSGCWARQEGSAFKSADFESQQVRTIAVLPVLNQVQNQVPMAFEPVLNSLVRQLRIEKKYAVVPTADTARILRQGAGAAMVSRMMNALSQSQPVPEDVYTRLARELEADALFTETIVAFHQVPEQGATIGNQGGTYYQDFDVSVVEVRGELWSAKSRSVVWRDQHLERYYHNSREGRNMGRAVEAATRQLLANFPVNTWAPVQAPSPTPVPSPVLSYRPFPTPADPLER